MIRKFNYTGRKKIARTRIDIMLFEEERVKTFDAQIDFDGLGLPAEAKVYIEPYFGLSFMRFACGSVGNFIVPDNTELTDIPYSDTVFFRIKVADETVKHGRLLAYADRIKPSGPEGGKAGHKSILPVNYQADIGQQVWKLTFDGPVPVLLLNRKIEHGKSLLKSAEFRTLVLPAIIREIMNELAREYPEAETDDESWAGQWLRFTGKTLRVHNKPRVEEGNDSEIRDWIDDVVNAFCRNNSALKIFQTTNLAQ